MDLFDIPEAARRLSTTVFAVRTLVRTNKLEYISIGHKMLIAPEFIDAFKNANKRRYSDEAPTTPTPAPPIQPLLTTEEVAGILKVNVRTIRRLVKSRRLPPMTGAGRHWRFSVESVRKYIEDTTARH